MVIQIEKKEFINLIENASFLENGDFYERKYAPIILENFPNIQEYWKWLVIPLTNRMNRSEGKLSTDIYLRNAGSIDERLVRIAVANYSVFLHLSYAHNHSDEKEDSFFEEIYFHLGAVRDSVETIIENWCRIKLECDRGSLIENDSITQENILSAKLTKEELDCHVNKWFIETYPEKYDRYLMLGDSIIFRIPSIKCRYSISEILAENLSRLETYTQNFYSYRNLIVHGAIIGRLVDDHGKIFVPKLTAINRYKKLSNFEDVRQDWQKKKNEFEEIHDQVCTSISNLEKLLDKIWAELVISFKAEFLFHERSKLRNLYKIVFGDTDYGGEKIDSSMENQILSQKNFGSATISIFNTEAGPRPDLPRGLANFPTKPN